MVGRGGAVGWEQLGSIASSLLRLSLSVCKERNRMMSCCLEESNSKQHKN